MAAKEVTIINETGLHARPAQLFVQKASEFASAIKVKKEGGATGDAKSILGLMSLGLTKGSKITIEASGDDAEQAVTTLAELVQKGFGEV